MHPSLHESRTQLEALERDSLIADSPSFATCFTKHISPGKFYHKRYTERVNERNHDYQNLDYPRKTRRDSSPSLRVRFQGNASWNLEIPDRDEIGRGTRPRIVAELRPCSIGRLESDSSRVASVVVAFLLSHPARCRRPRAARSFSGGRAFFFSWRVARELPRIVAHGFCLPLVPTYRLPS